METAFINAMDSIDIIRAMLQIGFQRRINLLAPEKDQEFPTDSIISLGQLHTFHFKSGKSAKNGFWYVRKFEKKEPVYIKDIKLAESNLSISLSQLRKSNFSNHITSVLIGYINSLDQYEPEFRFMKLWSALEKLVKSDNSTIIIKRISFFYEDRAMTKSILESLRKARNINVHSGISPLNVEMKNYHLCEYLERLLRFFIDNPFNNNQLSHMLDFISSATEIRTIDDQINKLIMVKKFISED